MKHNAHVRAHPAVRLADNNNCTVRALSRAFGISYVAAYCMAQKFGRPHGNGYSWDSYRETIRYLAKIHGKKLVCLNHKESRRDYGKTIVSAQRRLSATETVFFNVRGHTMCFRDGETNDWADGRRHHIWQVWRLTS